MTLAPEAAGELAARMAVDLKLTEPWRAVFAATPRHLFVPDRALHTDEETGRRTDIDRAADPDGWLRAVYTNDPIITQIDDGGAGDGLFTSSCSMPSMVAAMLDALDVHVGDHVLEVGTGTGWNAALLAHRLGVDHVVSIEIDSALAERARANLAAVGRPVTVVTGDGTAGWPAGAPYDGVIATTSVEVIPTAWTAQTRRGGRLVLPWGPPMATEHLVRLIVDGEGAATGGIIGPAAFMRIRDQRWHVVDEPDEFDDLADRTAVEVAAREVLGNHSRLPVALRLGEARAIFESGPDGGEVLWLLAADSWACVSLTTARQAGARRLWDEAVSAYRWWVALGRPDRDRFHITVEPARQWVWLDEPGNVVRAYA